MYKRLYNFLELHKILYQHQFGFCASHPVNHAFISLTESIKSSLDNKKLGCGIFLDLQKAFDTVNHQILLTNWNTIAFEVHLWHGSALILLTEASMYLLMVATRVI